MRLFDHRHFALGVATKLTPQIPVFFIGVPS